jgi:hypothetical protein
MHFVFLAEVFLGNKLIYYRDPGLIGFSNILLRLYDCKVNCYKHRI